jgi:hypothetical protein
MLTPYTVQQWFGEQAIPLLIVGVALVLGFAVLYFSAHSRRSALANARSGRTEESLVEDLEPFGFDPEIVRTTYRYLQENQNVAFPIVALDDLDHDLGLDSEDLSQTIHALLDATGRDHLPGLLYSPLVTVEDLVRYIQGSPRRAELAA